MVPYKKAIFILIVPLKYDLCYCECARAEYKIDKQCCPMCSPGNHVRWHCTDDTSTTCVPCPQLTFIDEPNGLVECFPCTVCDADRGLRLSEVCTRSSDTPLETLYRIYKSTGSTDTVCAECTGDTYSNGSFSSCLPHTKCEDMGLTETNPGTHSSDTKCGNPSTAVAIVASSIIVALIIILVIFFLIFKHIRKKKLSKSAGKLYSFIFVV
ncbi:tumor necrosis factor receptor superfamily member 14-like [Cyprinus carpio]|uniref:Tumor necrosis factor receptor superfamily member 14-like n=1 Tax=Cyprinus carpio TaxID=7962 RepID=A0A9Q9YFR8_CYPCA|nr:tumor necrosis factor receptor superfamily member 14-like [Cyprinus carpio]